MSDVRLTAEMVAEKQFTPVRLREGYSMEEVDHFLDQIQESLRSYQEELAAQAAVKRGLPSAPPPTVVASDNHELEITRQRLQDALSHSAELEVEVTRLKLATDAQPAMVPAPVDSLSSASAAAARTLEMAARQHDELIAAGEARRSEIVAEAEAEVQASRAAISERLAGLESEKAAMEVQIKALRELEVAARERLVAHHRQALEALASPSVDELVLGPASAPALDVSSTPTYLSQGSGEFHPPFHGADRTEG